MKIAFLIRALDLGGAERQLMLLAAGLRRAGHDVSVITFYGGGALEADLAAAGVEVVPLGKTGRWHFLGFFARLVRAVRRIDPDLLHGYLPPSNLLALALSPFARRTRIAWGIRSSNVNLAHLDPLARAAYRAERRLAPLADLVIANSEGGLEHNRVARGRVNGRVIPNGIDTAAMRPDAEARARMRSAFGLSNDHVVIGMAARIHPMKGHDILLDAAAIALREAPDLRFLCVGRANADTLQRLQARAGVLGIGDRVTWTGERSDMRAIYNAFDMATLSSSYGEGFSNAVGEAMACGVPCVVTDVGGVADIVGDAGIVVPPGDAGALAAGWLDMRDRLRIAGPDLAAAARRRMEEQFSVERLTERSLAAFRSVVPEVG